MKIAILGIEYKLGKHNLKDERLDSLQDLSGCSKKTHIQIDLIEKEKLTEADRIISTQDKKLDLIIEDLDIVEKRLANQENQDAISILSRLKEELEKDNLLCKVKFEDDFIKTISDYNLVTLKPIYIIEKGCLDLDSILTCAYKEFGFITFFTTAGGKEARAWSVKQGTSAYEAAGKIHTDIQKGFIRAEVINFEDLRKAGGIHEAKNKNLIHIENKDYIVKDADVINFKFSK